ncbi:hypothetical protein [Streptomyces sp. NPDC049555]|uniref:hypothetical protein n=1 Tax=Streptomyces sp. NPDC049555 TaxID=3154930 RepID=UPI0034480706
MHVHRQSTAARAVIASLALSLATTTLTTGCANGSGSGPVAGPAQQPVPLPSADVVLGTGRLEPALPDQFSVPADVSQSRTRKAWDSHDTAICRSEQWPSAWCSQAVAFGLAAYTNARDQELSMRLISFPTAKAAEALFVGDGAGGEVGKNPPGDQIEGFEVPADGSWEGRGFHVRQGSVIASIKYTWKQGTNIPPDRLMAVTRMTVERIKQAQHGDVPSAAAR